MAISAIVPSLRSMMYAFSPEPPASSVAAFQDRSTCPQLATVTVRPVGGKGGMRSVVCAKLVPAEERRAGRYQHRGNRKARKGYGWATVLRCLEGLGFGAPGRNRTCDNQLRRLGLSPTELRARISSGVKLVGARGFEPPTASSQSW